MDINSILSAVNPNFLLVLLTSLLALISWAVKGLIEKPLVDSRGTFNVISEKRIQILSEIKTRLAFIAYFPKEDESRDYKEQLQEILLRDGKIGFLNKKTFEAVLKISIDPKTDENLLLTTIQEIDDDLTTQVSKIQDEIKFYINFSNYHPLKRFLGFLILLVQYLASITFVILFLGLCASGFIYLNWTLKIILGLFLLFGSFGVGKLINR